MAARRTRTSVNVQPSSTLSDPLYGWDHHTSAVPTLGSYEHCSRNRTDMSRGGTWRLADLCPVVSATKPPKDVQPNTVIVLAVNDDVKMTCLMMDVDAYLGTCSCLH